MKKHLTIIFIFLALFFCSKDIIILTASLSDSTTFVSDISEEESSEKTEKKDIDEKDNLEKWQENISENLSALEASIACNFYCYTEKRHFTPYFEICSPPPESALV